MKLIIAGDTYISNKIEVDSGLKNCFEKSDFKIINLEAPITSATSKILKTGPHLFMHNEPIMDFLNGLYINIVSLANNHIKDYGDTGIRDTISFLTDNNIRYLGADNDIDKASTPLILESDQIKVALINNTDHEWSLADENNSGANPFDLIETYHQIKSLRLSNDYVICILHGGIDYYNLPSPRLRKKYRFLAEAGADFIFCHHSHRVSGWEKYKNSYIFYGLGNFAFTKNSNKSGWDNGLIVGLNLDKKIQNSKFDLMHTFYDKENNKLNLIDNPSEENILNNELKYLNKLILSDDLFHKAWLSHLSSVENTYLSYYSFSNGLNSKIGRFLINRFRLDKLFLSKRYLITILNLLRCDTHNEISEEILKKYISNEKS